MKQLKSLELLGPKKALARENHPIMAARFIMISKRGRVE